MKKTFLAVFLLSVLTACSHVVQSVKNKLVIPGSTLSTENKTIDQILNEKIQDTDINYLATVYPITPALLARLHQAQQQQLAQRHYPQFTPLEVSKRQYRYLVGRGDVLSIRVLNDLNLGTASGGGKQVASGTWVDESGQIFFPMAGKMSVLGKTLPEIQKMLTVRLARYFKNPQVDVNIAEFRSQSVSVNGSVKQSGRFPITNVPITLLDAVNMAGGYTENADLNRVKWTHRGQDFMIPLQDIIKLGKVQNNPVLQDGDIVFVPPREDKVFVMGEVGQQMALSLGNNGLNLTEALGHAQGMNQHSANPTGVFVIRNQPNDNPKKPIHIYQLNLADATAFALGIEFALQANDVVFVTAAPIARWNRVLSQAMPSISSVVMLRNTLK